MTIAVEEKTHAELGPSGWHTWGACPGSPALSEGMVDKGSSYARLGTTAHEVLERCILEKRDAEDFVGQSFAVEGDLIECDMDMADAVNTALAFIHERVDPERGDILMAEQQVPIGHLTGEVGATGTTDVLAIREGGRNLFIGDYKHGQGVMVPVAAFGDQELVEQGLMPELNGQLAMYGLGALEQFGLVYDAIETVTLAVMQPRKDYLDEITVPVAVLHTFGEAVTMAAGRVQMEKQTYREGGEVALSPGEKQCRFCKAKAICPALREQVSRALTVLNPAESSEIAEFEDLTLPKRASAASPATASPEALSEFFRAIPLIEEAVKAVRAEVERRLFAGDPVPGLKLVEGKKGNRQWNDEKEAAVELTKSGRLSAAEAYQKKPISPTAAEKLLKDRPKVWAKIAPLIVQRDGSPSVALESDKRPEYRVSSDVGDFADLSVEASASAAPALTVEDLMA